MLQNFISKTIVKTQKTWKTTIHYNFNNWTTSMSNAYYKDRVRQVLYSNRNISVKNIEKKLEK